MIKPVHAARWLAVAAAPLAAAAALAAALITPAAAMSSRPLAAATAPRCSAADLEVWVAADQSNGAAGTVSYPLEFTNISTHTCTLFGHPSPTRQPRGLGHLGRAAHRAARPRSDRLRTAELQRRHHQQLPARGQGLGLRAAGHPA